MRTLKIILLVVMAVFYVAAGVNHFVDPDFYLNIMPPYLPWHLELVYLSGGIEIVLGVALLIPPISRWAAWGVIALLLAVFPANIYLYQNPQLMPDVSETFHLIRLPLQGVAILWAFWHTRPAIAPAGNYPSDVPESRVTPESA